MEPGSGSQPFRIRPAIPADAPVIALHRARMFQDMGQLPRAAFDPLRAVAEPVLARALAGENTWVGCSHPPASPTA